MSDKSNYDCGQRIIAENVLVSNDTWETRINNNDIIIGSSGSGKTRGYVIPNILQLSNSMIISDTKGNLHSKFKNYLTQKGYKVLSLDFKNLYSESQCGYNPLSYIRYDKKLKQYSEQDIMKISAVISPAKSNVDPFWENSARIYIAILISYVLEACPKEKHNLLEVFDLYNEMDSSGFEHLFKRLAITKPMCFASRNYRQIINAKNAEKTYNCIKMTVYEKLQVLTIASLKKVYNNKNMINIADIGKEKTAVFLSISDIDRSLDTLVSLFYTQCFSVLIETADNNPESKLDVPVSFILDDFATNCKIENFECIIAVIRSREIYASIIIQNICQLNDVYGISNANTIINNCDVMLYLGGQDYSTADFISHKINKPVTNVLNLPLDKCYVLKNGEKFIESNKYDLVSHPSYEEWLNSNKNEELITNEI